jgi:hypothetical protein
MLQLNLDLVPDFFAERRREIRLRTEAVPARLTDLYRDRLPVTVLNVSRGGLGVKVQERFIINLPVLLECDGLLIVGNVRHCVKAAKDGYILGLRTLKVVDTSDSETYPGSVVRAEFGCDMKLFSAASWAV